ncbi:MAG: alpha/beta hydrolase-fold protein [Nitrospira sp.]|nr:alpha/beta hydrolase-fold protein [Nitrospira sp.]
MERTRTHGALTIAHEVPYHVDCPPITDPGARFETLMLLHGMGETPAFMRKRLGALAEGRIIVYPRAPWPFEVRNGDNNRIGFAWYVFSGDQQLLREGMELSAGHLAAIMAAVAAKHPVDPERTRLIGFSQGGYLAPFAAATHAGAFRAAASLSGRIKHEFLSDTPAETKERLPLLHVHGGGDARVLPGPARDSVEACRTMGFMQVEYHEVPGAGHEVTAPMVEIVKEWLGRIET